MKSKRYTTEQNGRELRQKKNADTATPLHLPTEPSSGHCLRQRFKNRDRFFKRQTCGGDALAVFPLETPLAFYYCKYFLTI